MIWAGKNSNRVSPIGGSICFTGGARHESWDQARLVSQ